MYSMRPIIWSASIRTVWKMEQVFHMLLSNPNLHGESSTAKVEEVLQGRPKQVHDQAVVIPLNAIVANVGNADAALQDLVNLKIGI